MFTDLSEVLPGWWLVVSRKKENCVISELLVVVGDRVVVVGW